MNLPHDLYLLDYLDLGREKFLSLHLFVKSRYTDYFFGSLGGPQLLLFSFCR